MLVNLLPHPAGYDVPVHFSRFDFDADFRQILNFSYIVSSCSQYFRRYTATRQTGAAEFALFYDSTLQTLL